MSKVPLSNFRVNKRPFTGLEIEGGYIKLARAVDTARGRKIVNLVVKKLAADSEKGVIAALKEITAELKGPTGPLTICIPRYKVTVRLFRFPAVSEREIEGMVGLQAVKELPFGREELISDYLVSERTKTGYSKGFLAIAHRDVVNGYVDIFKKAGLEPGRITFSTESVTAWYGAAVGRQKSRGCSVLIDIDSDNTEIVIFCDGRPVFSRGLAFGVVQGRHPADLKHKLAEEVKWTIEGYRRQEKPGGAIEKIILGGASGAVEGFRSFLSRELGLPCEVEDPLKNLICREDIAPVRDKDRVSLLRVLGMALAAGKGKQINLLPAALKEKQRIKSGRKKSATVLALLAAIILLIAGIFAREFYERRLRLSCLNTEIEKNAPLAQDVENMLQRSRLIAARRQKEGACVDVLRELHRVTPQDISLSSFSYDEQNKLAVFQGVSEDMSRIHSFIKSLEQSEYFKNVLSKYMRENKAKATEFKIECTLEK